MVGAALGGVMAQVVHRRLPGIEAPVGGYALLGMGGLLAGVTRAPLLAVIMIFELTQNTAVLLPMMAVSVLAVASARSSRRSRSTSRACARRGSSGRRRRRRRRSRP